MQTGAAGATEEESTSHRSAIRWIKRVLLLVVILFIPYAVYVYLLPELDIWSAGSVTWNFYGQMSSHPEKGLFFFDRPFDTIATLILCIPGFIFLRTLDTRPTDEPVKRIALATGVATFLLQRVMVPVYAFLGDPVSILLSPPLSVTLLILCFIVVPLIRRETTRVSDRWDLHRDDSAGVGRAHGEELEPRRVGTLMFGLALLAPQQASSAWGFVGITWSLSLGLGYEVAIMYMIHPIEWALVLSLVFGLGIVFAHRVWLCSMGLAGKLTTAVIGILSQLVAFLFSTFLLPLDGFWIGLPFPLLFLTGLLILFRCGPAVASSWTDSVVPSPESRQ